MSYKNMFKACNIFVLKRKKVRKKEKRIEFFFSSQDISRILNTQDKKLRFKATKTFSYKV
jgi:DNA-binding Xre family transcriptional regulator